MVESLIHSVAQKLVIANASWLSEIRTIGHMLRKSEEGLIITDGENEIGISDRDGNSGYIRFASDVNMTREDIRSLTSCNVTSSRYTYRLRLVVVAKTETPEDLTLLLATQINSMALTYANIRNIKARVNSGGSNSYSVARGEGAKEQISNTYKAVYIDFSLMFDWANDCDQIEINMTCDNCIETTDYGCYQHCSDILVLALVAASGVATVNTKFNGIVVTQSITVVAGENITLDLSGWNEDYLYTIQILNADGFTIQIYSKTDTGKVGVRYDCLTIKLLP